MPRRWSKLLCVVLASLVLGGPACSDDEPLPADEHEDVFGVRVAFDVNEIAPGGHVPINSGQVNRTMFNLYNHHGDRISHVDHYQLTIAFAPVELATAAEVSGTTNIFDITTTAAPETEGTMIVSVYHPHTEITKTFGPFDILIH